MSCCSTSIKPTISEVVPGVALFAFLFITTIVSVIGILYVLMYFGGS